MLYNRTLIIAPHPDDEVLGCGGLISRSVRENKQVFVAYATCADDVRHSELVESCKFLGVTDFAIYSASRIWLDILPVNNLVSWVESLVNSWTPDCILFPTPTGFHQEHRAMALATLAALRPSGGTGRCRPSTMAVYEEPFDSWTDDGNQFRPTMYVSLEQQDIDNKCQAMHLHKSQDRPSPSERSEDAIRALAALRGAQCGHSFAEAYEIRMLLR